MKDFYFLFFCNALFSEGTFIFQALQAIKQIKKSDPKVITHLENEIETIRSDHRQLEGHVERTALWSDHLGLWRVLVHKVQV